MIESKEIQRNKKMALKEKQFTDKLRDYNVVDNRSIVKEIAQKVIPIENTNILCYLKNSDKLPFNVLKKIGKSSPRTLTKLDRFCGKVLSNQQKREKDHRRMKSMIMNGKSKSSFFNFDESEKLNKSIVIFQKEFDKKHF